MTVQTASPIVTTDAMHFDRIYREAGGDVRQIPWADAEASPALVNWMNAIAPSLIRCGSRVAVVGCGLGDDAREIMRRGYDVVAFDCSATAVQWARNRFPQMAGAFYEADLLELPPRWLRRFDLVVEINTLQSLSPDLRPAAFQAAVDLMAPHGRLLIIARAAEGIEDEADGPPWPIAESELHDWAEMSGLELDGPIAVFDDDEDPPVLRLRALFRRA